MNSIHSKSQKLNSVSVKEVCGGWRGKATLKFLDGITQLLEAGRPSILAGALRELSQNTEKSNELASKGLEFARRNFDAEIVRGKYLDWVNSLIQSKRG